MVMKINLIPLILTTLTSAFGQTVNSQQMLNKAAEDADKLNEIVGASGKLSSECREDVKTMNRIVLVKDEKVKPITCIPDANSLTAPDGIDHTVFLKENNKLFAKY